MGEGHAKQATIVNVGEQCVRTPMTTSPLLHEFYALGVDKRINKGWIKTEITITVAYDSATSPKVFHILIR